MRAPKFSMFSSQNRQTPSKTSEKPYVCLQKRPKMGRFGARACSGVLFSTLFGRQLHRPDSSLSSLAIIFAMSPMRVSMPVATTTPCHSRKGFL